MPEPRTNDWDRERQEAEWEAADAETWWPPERVPGFEGYPDEGPQDAPGGPPRPGSPLRGPIPRPVLGYVCDECWWWVPTLSQEDPHCRHPRVHLVEHLTGPQVQGAKERAGVWP